VLSLEERWESLRGAFATHSGSQVDNVRVLLAHDVLTTGVTLDPCARVLREAEARSVAGFDRGSGRQKPPAKHQTVVR
jgi:predicted amidophosphoribosyltransferase